jgi:hypothetical protein
VARRSEVPLPEACGQRHGAKSKGYCHVDAASSAYINEKLIRGATHAEHRDCKLEGAPEATDHEPAAQQERTKSLLSAGVVWLHVFNGAVKLDL